MYCSKCGNELKSGENFCPKCGAKVGSNGKFPIYLIIIALLVLIIIVMFVSFASFKNGVKKASKNESMTTIAETSDIIESQESVESTENEETTATTAVQQIIQTTAAKAQVPFTVPTTTVNQTTVFQTMGTGVVVNAPPMAETTRAVSKSETVKSETTTKKNDFMPPISPDETTIIGENNGPDVDNSGKTNVINNVGPKDDSDKETTKIRTVDGKATVAPSEDAAPGSSQSSSSVKIKSTSKVSETYEGDEYDCKITLLKPNMQGKDSRETEAMDAAITDLMSDFMGWVEEIADGYDTFPKSIIFNTATLGSTKKTEVIINIIGTASFKSGSTKNVRFRITYDREDESASIEEF